MNNFWINRLKLTITLLALVNLASCGGGGKSGSSSAPPARVLSIVAAVGTPIVNGNIDVICATGSAISTSTSGAGTVQVTLSGQTLPCAVRLWGGTINGIANMTHFHSIATAAGNVNVTPLTDLLVANLAGTATPSSWFSGLSATPAPLAAITQYRVDAAAVKLGIALSGLTTLSAVHPVTTAFTPTAGDPSDDMLTALATAMTNTGVTHSALLSNA
ncbi:MAG: hypothetical protein AAB278_01670, partial [Pseudomonadota bacterium]